MTDHEQPAAGVALDPAERIMREFYVSNSYDPNAERPADVVKAAIAFALKAPTDAGGAVSEAMVEAAVAVTGDGRAITRRALEAALSAPQPLQQGGEVTREALAQSVRDILYGVALSGEEPIGATADRILALFAAENESLAEALRRAEDNEAIWSDIADEQRADRDKAVGLLREWLASRTYGQRVALHAETDAFLSSQTEGG